MKLTHASVRPLSASDFRTPDRLETRFKPAGCLWMSRDHDWFQNFNQGCNAHDVPYNHAYEAHVSAMDLYWITTVAAALAFEARFAVRRCNGAYHFIDWDRVRRETWYKGIYVNPHAPGFRSDPWSEIGRDDRLRFDWYGHFEFESVAMWDPSGITAWTEVPLPHIDDTGSNWE